MSARDEAAEMYPPLEHDEVLRALTVNDILSEKRLAFLTGWDAALAEPTDAEIWEACRVHYLAKNGFDGWEQVTLRDADENIRWMFEAIKAFLAARKGKTP